MVARVYTGEAAAAHDLLSSRPSTPFDGAGESGSAFFLASVSAGAMAVVLEAVSRCAYGKEYCQQSGGSFIGDRQ